MKTTLSFVLPESVNLPPGKTVRRLSKRLTNQKINEINDILTGIQRRKRGSFVIIDGYVIAIFICRRYVWLLLLRDIKVL